MGLWCFCVSCKWDTNYPFFWTIFSRMFVKQTTLRYRDSVSLWSKGQACLLLLTNDSGFLNSWFLYCRAIHHVGKYPPAFSALLFGNWGLGKLAPKCWYSGCCLYLFSIQFSSVHSLSHVWLFATQWTAARQASLSITNSQSLPKLMSIESVMPSNHLILCNPLLLLPSIFPSIRVFSNEPAVHIRWPKYWSFSFNISPSNEQPGLISFRMDWLDLLAVQGTLKSLLQHHKKITTKLVTYRSTDLLPYGSKVEVRRRTAIWLS